MPSYVVTGTSRGLGWEFLRQLSADSNNTVIGLVRDKPSTDKRVAEELPGRSNIHILQADITDYDALKNSVDEVSKITGGSLDYLVANAGYVSQWDAYDNIGVLAQKPKELEEDLVKAIRTNVVGNINLFSLYIPLILKSPIKKVITLSTGLADLDPINQFEHGVAALYAMSKAASNIAVAKFNAQYKKDGVLFISISPGMIDVGQFKPSTPEQLANLQGMLAKFMEYAPGFKGPSTPEAAIKDVISVWEKASIEDGFGGAYVSHHGNKQWL